MAFNAIVSPSAASTSSKKPCYAVFINHRGKDVKHKLASTIYNVLDLMGVQAFLDQEELEVGDSFPHAIEEAMRTASVHIAIFSPSYAESPWCLEELLFMLQINVTIIPVFYHVQPSDLRYFTKGKYAYAFGEHERKGRYNPQKIEEWKDALKRVSYLCGSIVVDDDKRNFWKDALSCVSFLFGCIVDGDKWLYDVDSPSPPNVEYISQKLIDLRFSFKHGFRERYNDSIDCCKNLDMFA